MIIPKKMFFTQDVPSRKSSTITSLLQFGTLLLVLFSAETIIAQPKIQWASKVLGFSSERVDANNPGPQYRAIQVLGKPNTYTFQHTSAAWSTEKADNYKNEFIKVAFATPAITSNIIIVENLNPGAITQVFAYDSTDTEYLIHENNNHTIEAKGRFWNISITKTNYRVHAVKIILNPNLVNGFNQIDAIGISGENTKLDNTLNLPDALPKKTIRENLGKSINSDTREVAPIISNDGKRIFFTREVHKKNIGKYKLQDIWMAESINENKWSEAKNIGSPINTDEHNALTSVSLDGKTIYLLNVYLPNNTFKPGLSKSTFQDGKWSFPKEVKLKDYYTTSSYTEFSISSNEQVLIIAAQRKDTFGQKDLYVSFLENDSTWSKPINLGNTINTAENESTPFLAADTKTLYFSTSGLPGYGDNDIFMTHRLDSTWTNWSEPLNLGNAINTPKWDGYFTVSATGDYAYTSSEENSIGAEDIFRIKLFPSIQPEPVAILSGVIKSEIDDKPIKASIFVESLDKNTSFSIESDDDTGEFKLIIPVQHSYQLTISNKNFKPLKAVTDLSNFNSFTVIKKEFILTRQ
ncbi:MAG: flagellar motor protein MotB [Emticicia sp.]|uniref:flagellar motor protein MotB n=1 Tax=Emticicia sp. TaxID=1930953 RepID=UPI003BA7F1AE